MSLKHMNTQIYNLLAVKTLTLSCFSGKLNYIYIYSRMKMERANNEHDSDIKNSLAPFAMFGELVFYSKYLERNQTDKSRAGTCSTWVGNNKSHPKWVYQLTTSCQQSTILVPSLLTNNDMVDLHFYLPGGYIVASHYVFNFNFLIIH